MFFFLNLFNSKKKNNKYNTDKKNYTHLINFLGFNHSNKKIENMTFI